MRRLVIAVGMLGVVGFVTAATAPQVPQALRIGWFSAAPVGLALPREWEPLTFDGIDRHTRYELVDDNGTRVVRATADAAASGLIRRIRIDPNDHPILQWRWKIANLIDGSDVSQKSADDYPARLYVTFEFDPEHAGFIEAAKYRAARALFGSQTPYRALNYIWERKAARGSIVPNPYTDWAMMVVVRNGTDTMNRWVNEERNIVEDYRKAFGTAPPKISGIALMTDSDNTRASATAWYGDIVLRKATAATR